MTVELSAVVPEDPEDEEEVSLFASALTQRREATRTLVGVFVAQAGQATPDIASIQSARRKATTDVSTFAPNGCAASALTLLQANSYRSEVKYLKKQLEGTQTELEKARSDLQSAEYRVERLRREALFAPKATPAAEPAPAVDETRRSEACELTSTATVRESDDIHPAATGRADDEWSRATSN